MKQNLKEWYLSLPQREALPKQQEIINRCYITRAVFYNWINGVTEVPKVCRPIINRIAGYNVFDA